MEIIITCSFSGNNFNPKTLLSKGLNLKNIIEKGTILSKGRYKNKKSPYSHAEISSNDLSALLRLIDENIIEIRDAGAEELIIHADLKYQGQCNWEISKVQLKKIAELDIALTISCFEY